ncbi:MAG TPA: PadR family transcriptional regulator [Anaerolineae bacterium]
MSEAQLKSTYASALSPEYALLGFLSLRQAHGYELHRRLIDELGQVWHVSLSQTYNILTRLERQGYITRKTLEREKLPARREFELTPSGQRHFEQWLQIPTGCSVRAIRVEFITRLYFASARNSELARDMIQAQVEEVEQGIRRLREALAVLPTGQTFNRLGLTMRIRQLASVLDWLSECQDALGLKK